MTIITRIAENDQHYKVIRVRNDFRPFQAVHHSHRDRIHQSASGLLNHTGCDTSHAKSQP